MTNSRFGTLEWALEKLAYGFSKGCKPGLSDCHKRAGYAVRVLRDVMPEAELHILATPKGQIAHSMVVAEDRVLRNPADRLVLQSIKEYKTTGRVEVSKIAAALDHKLGSMPDGLDPIAGRLLLSTQDPEQAFVRFNEALDGLLFAEARNPGRGYGFMIADRHDMLLLADLEQHGLVHRRLEHGEQVFFSLSDEGKQKLFAHWRQAHKASAMDAQELDRRYMLLMGVAQPSKTTSARPLAERQWVDREGNFFDAVEGPPGIPLPSQPDFSHDWHTGRTHQP